MFSHTPDEARSGGLAKACVPGKNYSVLEKIESLNSFININNTHRTMYNMTGCVNKTFELPLKSSC